jgi:GT2 family glycosyltransferase
MIKRVLCIIVDFKSTEEAKKLSLQLAQSSTPSFQITICHFDNGNQPTVGLSSDSAHYAIELFRSPTNLGYAGALNTAIRQSEKSSLPYDAYWLLNSDLEIDSKCLSKLVEVLDTHPNVGAVGPLIRKAESRESIWGARGSISPFWGMTAMGDWEKGGILPRWSYLPGCSILVRAKAYWEVGGLPELYKLYFEETEFCVQLQKRGWYLWVERSATVYHHVYSLKNGIPARHFAYYFIRNNLVFWKRNFGIPMWIQLPRTLFVALKEVALPLRRASSLKEFLDRLKYLFAGLWDGILFSRKRPVRFERQLFP